MNNKDWSEKIIRKFAPTFRHRWELYNEILINSLNSDIIWIDCGCGNNGMVEEYGKFAKTAIGFDITENTTGNFVKADIRHLPLSSDYADLITLRFVVEHFENSEDYITELKRVLKKDGKIIILTTNLLSPLIFLPRFLLPYSLKSKILTRLFKVKDDDVFPTYHKLNTQEKFKELGEDFDINSITFISDLNYTRKWVFTFLLIWHKIISLRTLNKFRTNILVVLKKK